MELKKNKILSILVIAALIFILISPSEAIAFTNIQSYSNENHTFTSSWSESKTINYSGSTCVLTYGFDTTLINEDYAYAYSNGSLHRSKITNYNGSFFGYWVYANDWSDKEVTHRGTSIYYYHQWE